jgi:hypothetical protein
MLDTDIIIYKVVSVLIAYQVVVVYFADILESVVASQKLIMRAPILIRSRFARVSLVLAVYVFTIASYL